MSDGITLNCPFCDGRCIQKEYDYLEVQLKSFDLKHPQDENWYKSHLPVYTCPKCKQQCVIEVVNK